MTSFIRIGRNNYINASSIDTWCIEYESQNGTFSISLLRRSGEYIQLNVSLDSRESAQNYIESIIEQLGGNVIELSVRRDQGYDTDDEDCEDD